MSKFHPDPLLHAHMYSTEQFGISETSFSLCHQLVLNIPTVQHKADKRTLHPDWCETILPSIRLSVCLSVCLSVWISSSSFFSALLPQSSPPVPPLHPLSSPLRPPALVILCPTCFSSFPLSVFFLFGFKFSLKADYRCIHLVGQERHNLK